MRSCRPSWMVPFFMLAALGRRFALAANRGGEGDSRGPPCSDTQTPYNSPGGARDPQQNCMTTASDHEATVKERAEELVALAEVKQLLAGTSAGAAQQTYSLFRMLAVTGAASRIQSRADLPEAEVVNMAKRLAREYQSAALAELASRIAPVLRYGSAAGADPLCKGKVAYIRTYCTVGGRGISGRHGEGLLQQRDREDGSARVRYLETDDAG